MSKYHYLIFILLLIIIFSFAYIFLINQNAGDLDMSDAYVAIPFSAKSISLDLSIPTPPILIGKEINNETINVLKYITKIKYDNNRIYIEGIRMYLIIMMGFFLAMILLIRHINIRRKNIYIDEYS